MDIQLLNLKSVSPNGIQLPQRIAKESRHTLSQVIYHFRIQSRIDASPEGIVHDSVCVLQRPANPEFSSSHTGLVDEVATEEQSSTDSVLFQIPQQI